MKKANKVEYLVFVAVFLISMAVIVFAQGNTKEQTLPMGDDMSAMGEMRHGEDMMANMQKMHEEMAKGVDPAMKAQMDKMHEACMKMHEKIH